VKTFALFRSVESMGMTSFGLCNALGSQVARQSARHQPGAGLPFVSSTIAYAVSLRFEI
jgi:hypothetical protein